MLHPQAHHLESGTASLPFRRLFAVDRLGGSERMCLFLEYQRPCTATNRLTVHTHEVLTQIEETAVTFTKDAETGASAVI